MIFGVKPPGNPQVTYEEEKEESRSGHITHAEYATWFGNAIVLGSIGCLALIVADPNRRNKQLGFISDIFIATSVAVLLWASFKYFFIRTTKLHWSSYVFLIFVLSTLAALLWIAAVL